MSSNASTRITLDASEFEAELGLQGVVSPRIAQAVSDTLSAGDTVGLIEVRPTKHGTELRYALRVSDQLRQRCA